MLVILTKHVGEESALFRRLSPTDSLRRETQQARTDLLLAINRDREGSPLASIKAPLNAQLAAHDKSTQQQLEAARKQSAESQRHAR